MLSRKFLSFTVTLFLGLAFNVYSQNIRNTIIKDINTNNQNATILDFMDWKGKTYLLSTNEVGEKPQEYRSYRKFQLASIDHTTKQFTVIKEDSLLEELVFVYGKFFQTDSDYFYFSFNNDSQTEIWYSNGLSSGTQMVTRTIDYLNSAINNPLGVIKNSFYYYNYIDDDYNFEIYKITGNAAPVRVGSGQNLVTIKTGEEKVYFITYNGPHVNGYSIDFNGNTSNFYSADFTFYKCYLFEEINKKMVFSTNSIYITDGTQAGTNVVAPTPYSDFVSIHTYKVKNKICFEFNNSLWTTDGTAANTFKVDDDVVELLPFHTGSDFYYLKRPNSGNTGLWKTNISTKTLVKDIFAVRHYAVSTDSNSVYFSASNLYDDIFKYDIPSSTVTHPDLELKYIYGLKVIANDLYVLGEVYNSTLATQLYVYKNNNLSLYRVLNTNTQSGYPDNITVFDKYIVYTADGNIVVSQGLPENTTAIPMPTGFSGFIGDFLQKNDTTFYNFNTSYLGLVNTKAKTMTKLADYPDDILLRKTVKVNGQFILMRENELLRYNPDNNSFVTIKNFGNTGRIDFSPMIVYKNELYFILQPDSAYEIWKTNGTNAGTQRLKSFPVNGYSSSYFRGFFTVNNTLLIGFTIDNVSQLWKTDGTAGETKLVKNFPLTQYGISWNGLSRMVSDGRNLYFTMNEKINYQSYLKLYRINDSLTDIELMGTIDEYEDSYSMCYYNDNIYFFTSKSFTTVLWKFNTTSLSLNSEATFFKQDILRGAVCVENVLWAPMVENRKYYIYARDLASGQSKRIMQAYLLESNGLQFDNPVFTFKNSIVYRRLDYKYGHELFIAGICDNVNTRNNSSHTGDYYHTDSVISTEKIVTPNIVNVFSPKNIILQPGFEAKSGSVYYAAIKQCN